MSVGMSESSVWDLIEVSAENLGVDPGEVFAEIYQPEGLDDG